MSNRHSRKWMRWGASLLLLALVLAAFVAPVGLARGSGERASQREVLAAVKATEREERMAARRAAREAERAARNAQREATEEKAAATRRSSGDSKDRARKEGTVVTVSCTQVTWEFGGFPDKPHNTVTGVITIRDRQPALKLPENFSFDGPASTQTTAIDPLPGHYLVDAQAHWNTNGHKGGFDIHINKQCAADPSLSIEKLQQVSAGSYTSSPLTGGVGQSVNYKMIVKNTGNVPVTLGSFSDPQCDAGTIAGPNEPALAIGDSTTYTCSHALNSADRTAGSYENTVTITGTPPDGEGSPITRTSNTVVVTVPPLPPFIPAPSFSIEKLQRVVGGYTASTLSGNVGQRVEYEIILKNTGNVALTLSGFSDPQCDAGTITEPSGMTLAVGTSTSYLCTHLLNSSDLTAGSYSNTAATTGTPPPGEGTPITQTSNTVIVTVGASNPGSPGTNNTPTTPTGSSGILVSSSAGSGSSQTSVLGFTAAEVPTLSGPQGCVRSNFKVSIKSTGVQSVTFYLDGHKLKTLTAKNAHKGRLTIVIDPAKLRLGAHRLLAKITMSAHGASTKATRASRAITILRCSSAVGTPKFTG